LVTKTPAQGYCQLDLDQNARELLDSLPDEVLENVLSKISLSMPWQLESEQPLQDADGFDSTRRVPCR
jgi:hypothetical protein